MAMGLGVGSGEEIADAEVPLGHGEEPQAGCGAGISAWRVRRRVRQRAKKRRIREVAEMGTLRRVEELEAQAQAQRRHIGTLCKQIGAVRTRARMMGFRTLVLR